MYNHHQCWTKSKVKEEHWLQKHFQSYNQKKVSVCRLCRTLNWPLVRDACRVSNLLLFLLQSDVLHPLWTSEHSGHSFVVSTSLTKCPIYLEYWLWYDPVEKMYNFNNTRTLKSHGLSAGTHEPKSGGMDKTKWSAVMNLPLQGVSGRHLFLRSKVQHSCPEEGQTCFASQNRSVDEIIMVMAIYLVQSFGSIYDWF